MTPDAVKEIREFFERCRRRYPTISLSFESYCSRVEGIIASCHGGHAAAGGAPICPDCASQLRQLHHEDLYLATACVSGDRIAWECFTDEYLPMLKRFAQQACRNCDASEDLSQDIITKLLGESLCVTEGGCKGLKSEAAQSLQNPASVGKLASYNGRGSMAGWLRAAVSHAAIDGFRRAARQVSLEQMEEEGRLAEPRHADPGDPPEERLDSHWGPILARTLKEELESLCARDRLLLNLYYVEGVPLKAIGIRFDIHEATASRWLERLRRRLRKRVERKMRKRHRLSARELNPLWHWISEAEVQVPSDVRTKSARETPYREKVQGDII